MNRGKFIMNKKSIIDCSSNESGKRKLHTFFSV